jgi:tetratricopeptide (TPR) repeat protein
MSPAYSLAYQSLGEVYFQKHQYSQSIDVLKRAITLNATVTSFKYMILSEVALKNMENATAIYKEAIKRFNKPNDLRVLKAAYEQIH